MAAKNLRKSFSFYVLYLLSVSLVITIHFAFTSFSMNQVMLEKISSDGRVESMCSMISIFLMAFVVFFMTYSNRFFLKRRTKELGIYALLGYRKTTILSLLTFENVLICCGALCTGVLLGAIMHKGIVAGITALLRLSIDTAQIPFFEVNAIRKTVCFILLVIVVLSISNGRFLFQSSLMSLVRFEKKAEKNMSFHFVPSVIGLVMTVLGYVLALDIFRGRKSLWISVGFYQIGLLTAMLILLGTIFFISSSLPYVMKNSKKNKQAFYTETRIITTPNFVYRIRSNARTLIMLTLLSAATLTVASVMALTLYYPIASVSRMAPSELEFRVANEDQIDAVKRLVNQYAPDAAVTFTQTDICKITSSSASLPMEYSAGSAKGDSQNEKILRDVGFECISYTQYHSLLLAQKKDTIADQIPALNDTECILVKYQPNADGSDESGSVYSLNIDTVSIPLTVRGTTLHNPISFANSVGTLIVSDNVYEQIRASAAPKTSILSINGKAIEDNEDLFADLSVLLENSPYLQGNSHRLHVIFSLNSSTFLLIGFLVVLFFIATGSILYFNNISALTDTKADYEILHKMGYANKAIKNIIKKQVFTFFCIPFTFGFIDCIFATIVYKTGLMQNLLGNSLALYVPTIIAIALTASIYLFYYWLTVHSCCKIISKL
ncbi:MAG: FtsX-like permease family protein [Lachnospiraceae bacterium]|nr:FtsX-like permease family protein [Lachnospiraceae bacterium]MDE7201280.1 FtsX-like permease family protein [Lachnospiraceae bacterium]